LASVAREPVCPGDDCRKLLAPTAPAIAGISGTKTGSVINGRIARWRWIDAVSQAIVPLRPTLELSFAFGDLRRLGGPTSGSGNVVPEFATLWSRNIAFPRWTLSEHVA
jgi:hypothetical protein